MSNPETTLVWHPLRQRLTDLRMLCIANEQVPPHWSRIESHITGAGIPDVNWSWGHGTEGFVELKHRGDRPSRPETPCVIASITAHQRLWWRQRHQSGGRIHVLTRVGQEWFLHDGDWAAANLGYVTLLAMGNHSLLDGALPDARVLLQIMGARA